MHRARIWCGSSWESSLTHAFFWGLPGTSFITQDGGMGGEVTWAMTLWSMFNTPESKALTFGWLLVHFSSASSTQQLVFDRWQQGVFPAETLTCGLKVETAHITRNQVWRKKPPRSVSREKDVIFNWGETLAKELKSVGQVPAEERVILSQAFNRWTITLMLTHICGFLNLMWRLRAAGNSKCSFNKSKRKLTSNLHYYLYLYYLYYYYYLLLIL